MPNTYKKIASAVVGSGGNNTITFTSIPQTYTDLKIVVSGRLTDNNGQTWSDYALKFNSSNNNYNGKYVYGSGTAALSGSDSSYINARTNAAGQTANIFGSTEFYIPNYTGSQYKNVNIDTVSENNNATSITMMVSSLWSSNDPITRIDLVGLFGNFAQYTTATLYGIGDVVASKFAKATGGVITYDANYVYHTYPYSGTFTPNTALTVDYLVVAGGGGGGGNFAGGGGAGGVRCTVGTTGGGGSPETPLSLSSGSAYTVTVGAGGPGDSGSGNNSIFGSITSTGGGLGGGGTAGGDTPGGAGGSGGGGGGVNGSVNQNPNSGGTRTASPIQGNNGGVGRFNRVAGGGGGAGAVGGSASGTTAGTGGNGITISISGISTTYAGGGGGGSLSPTGNANSGGTGGGGAGSATSGATASAGTVNTGSGGGGGPGNGSGGAGGSGIVIIRYPR